MSRRIILLATIHLWAVSFAVYPCYGQFDGFKRLKVPRSNIPIGALWTDAGPILTVKVPPQTTSSISYYEFNSVTDKNLKSELDLSIISYLSATAGFSNVNNIMLSLESVKIITVSDLEYIKRQIGNAILYEGILADSITFSVDRAMVAELKADLSKTFKNVTIISQNDFGNKTRLVTQGINLYLAYRVVKLEQKKSINRKLHFSMQSSSSRSEIHQSNVFIAECGQYTITLCPCDIIKCADEMVNKNADNPDTIKSYSEDWLNSCVQQNEWLITIADKNEFSSGTPKKTYQNVHWDFDIWNKDVALSYKIKSTGIEIEYLNVKHLFFQVQLHDPKVYGKYRHQLTKGNRERVYLVTEKIIFKNIIPKSKNGW